MSIYGVSLYPNSIAGTETKISWSTSPSDACDKLDWGPTTSYGNTVYLTCGAHSYQITGLTVHKTYYYRITSSLTGYFSRTYSGSFHPVDVSLRRASESYSEQYYGNTNCNDIVIDYNYFSAMPGDIAFDPVAAQGASNYEVFDMHFHYYGLGQDLTGFCWQYRATTKHTKVELWITDHSGVVDWINAHNLPIFSGYSANSAELELGVSVGPDLRVVRFGATAGFSPGSTIWRKDIPDTCVDQGGGTKYCGWVQADWPGDNLVEGDFIWPMIVTDSKAQYRLWDKVTFTIKWTIVFDTYNHWFHYWYGNTNNVVTWTVVLGDGTYNGGNLLDAYTNMQQGYVTGPEA